MNAYERRAACPRRHCEHRDGQWQRGEDDTYGFILQVNGRPTIKAECRECGARSGSLPLALWRQWAAEGAQLEWVQRNDLSEYAQDYYEPCIVQGCGDTPTEWHHFSPRNIFGDEAEGWPCLPLCRPHHREWHSRMDGYRWNAKRAA